MTVYVFAAKTPHGLVSLFQPCSALYLHGHGLSVSRASIGRLPMSGAVFPTCQRTTVTCAADVVETSLEAEPPAANPRGFHKWQGRKPYEKHTLLMFYDYCGSAVPYGYVILKVPDKSERFRTLAYLIGKVGVELPL